MSLRRTCAFLGVVSSDTIRVEWEEQPRLVRLRDVDPEPSGPGGRKYPTHFGQRTFQWLRDEHLRGVQEIDIEFPDKTAALSNSGKLLAHVHVGGESVNVKLIRQGWSPCFNKYGHPVLHRAAMEKAELLARLEGRGVWGGQGSRGDYRQLKAYWNLRAGQTDGYLQTVTLGEDVYCGRRDYDTITTRAAAKSRAWVFVDLIGVFHMADGAVLMQACNPQQPLSIYFPPVARSLAGFVEREFVGFGKANYVYLNGLLEMIGEHPQITIEHLDEISTWPPKNTV